MRAISARLAVLAITTLGACQTTQNEATLSGFTAPTATGAISGDLSGQPVGRLIDSDGDGFAYAAGSVKGEGLLAQSGLVAGTDVTFRPSLGTGTYSGRFALVQVDDISFSGTFISGRRTGASGDITLNVDFERRTLGGSSGDLSVSGTLDNRTLTGSSNYRGVSGSLTGLVGGDKTVAVFHGNDADLIYAGGFLADRD